MAYELENMHPSSGRMIKEDGSTVNIADLLADLFAEEGFLKTANYPTTITRRTNVLVANGFFLMPWQFFEGIALPPEPLANRHTIRIKYRSATPVKLCNHDPDNGNATHYYTLEPMIEYVFHVDPEQEVKIYAMAKKSVTVEIFEEA